MYGSPLSKLVQQLITFSTTLGPPPTHPPTTPSSEIYSDNGYLSYSDNGYLSYHPLGVKFYPSFANQENLGHSPAYLLCLPSNKTTPCKLQTIADSCVRTKRESQHRQERGLSRVRNVRIPQCENHSLCSSTVSSRTLEKTG